MIHTVAYYCHPDIRRIRTRICWLTSVVVPINELNQCCLRECGKELFHGLAGVDDVLHNQHVLTSQTLQPIQSYRDMPHRRKIKTEEKAKVVADV